MIADDKKTFVASVRCDMRNIASIALLIKSEGKFVETSGKVASEAIKILGNLSQKKYPVETYKDAVLIMRNLGYEDPFDKKNARYYNALEDKLKFEESTSDSNTQDIIREHALKMREESQTAATVSMGDRRTMESSLDMVDEKPESSEPLDMPSNEEARSAFGDMSGAPVEDEGER